MPQYGHMFPSPEMFEDWRPWARAMMEALDSKFGPDEIEVLQLVRIPVANLPSKGQDGLLVFVPDEDGGAVPAFSDGSDWRRVTDRAVVS